MLDVMIITITMKENGKKMIMIYLKTFIWLSLKGLRGKNKISVGI
jgi:hypothetical protein